MLCCVMVGISHTILFEIESHNFKRNGSEKLPAGDEAMTKSEILSCIVISNRIEEILRHTFYDEFKLTVAALNPSCIYKFHGINVLCSNSRCYHYMYQAEPLASNTLCVNI